MKKISLAIACVAILGTATYAENGGKEKTTHQTTESSTIKKQKKHHMCPNKHKMEKTVSEK